jgi:hypothetical protein
MTLEGVWYDPRGCFGMTLEGVCWAVPACLLGQCEDVLTCLLSRSCLFAGP